MPANHPSSAASAAGRRQVARICINGRFLSQQLSGVQRVGREILTAFDGLIEDDLIDRNRTHVEVLAPRGVGLPQHIRNIPLRHVGRLTGHPWEQAELVRGAGDGILLNLCNTAPALARHQLVLIHDAAVHANPKAYTAHFRAWYRLLWARLARSPSRLLTVSEFSRSELAKHLGVAPSRLSVISEGADHITRVTADDSILTRHGLTARPYLLAVSSTSPNKNFGAVARAIALLGANDVDFVVAGGVNPRVFSAAGSALPPSVRHVGHVSDAELRALYEHAACFVFPSLYEGFGLPPLEAMACGCPVIASQTSSIPETCGNAVLYCDPASPADIADKISKLISNDVLRGRLRAKGIARARQFSWRRSALSVWQHCEQMIESGPSFARRAAAPRHEVCALVRPKP